MFALLKCCLTRFNLSMNGVAKSEWECSLMQALNGSDNDLQTLYLTTKMLFAHAQASISTSTSLIQASLLIATYEYGHGLIEAAYISIGTCVRMGYTAGLHKGKFGCSSLGCQSWPTLKDEEEHNLWWGIVICERYGWSRILTPFVISHTQSLKVRRFIISEKSIADQPCVVQFPDGNEYLPADSDLLDQRLRTDVGSSHRHQVLAFDSYDVGSFGREVQAAYLYNSVREAMYIKETSVAITQLKLLDSKLQRFFGNITCQSGTTWGLYCGSISFIIAYAYTLAA